MAKHFLAINHESYDASTVFGVFDTFAQARDHLEELTAKPDAFSSPRNAVIEEWDGPHQVGYFERDWENPLIWKDTRYRAQIASDRTRTP